MSGKEDDYIVSDETAKIMKDVNREGGLPLERLCAKCAWEHLSQSAVIKCWGDPRKWDNKVVEKKNDKYR